VTEHDEIDFVSFEFGTAGRSSTRLGWYCDRLEEFAAAVGRPLTAVIRGGRPVLPRLSRAFSDLVYIDTNAFLKAIHRQRLSYSGNVGLSECPNPTAPSAPLDALLASNAEAMSRSIEAALQR